MSGSEEGYKISSAVTERSFGRMAAARRDYTREACRGQAAIGRPNGSTETAARSGECGYQLRGAGAQ